VHIDSFDFDRKMTVIVEDDKLSLAIGRNGQNARLASKLTGWKVNILSESQHNENRKRDAELLIPVSQVEGIGVKIRDRLIEADISSAQRLAQSSIESLTKIEGIGERTAQTLIDRAKELVERVEIEYERRLAKERAAAPSDQTADQKLDESDVFEDDSEYVTEEDDVREVEAPDIDEEIGEEDESEIGPVKEQD
jgi:N utilization substance protein A